LSLLFVTIWKLGWHVFLILQLKLIWNVNVITARTITVYLNVYIINSRCRLVTLDMGWKVRGGAVPLSAGEARSRLTQCHLGRGLPPYQVVSWSIQPFGHNTPTLQTDRQTNTTDRTTVPYSIGRTVTCSGRPKITKKYQDTQNTQNTKTTK